jgi:hypothetical protein
MKRISQKKGADNAQPQKTDAQYSRVEISRGAFESLMDDATAHGANDTGGRLAGFIDAERRVLCITHATPGAPEALRKLHLYQSDMAYDQSALDMIVKQTQGKSDYVGEWHRHTLGRTLPPMDVAALQAVAASPAYATPQPVLLVCSLPDATKPKKRHIAAYACDSAAISEMPLEIVPMESFGIEVTTLIFSAQNRADALATSRELRSLALPIVVPMECTIQRNFAPGVPPCELLVTMPADIAEIVNQVLTNEA